MRVFGIGCWRGGCTVFRVCPSTQGVLFTHTKHPRAMCQQHSDTWSALYSTIPTVGPSTHWCWTHCRRYIEHTQLAHGIPSLGVCLYVLKPLFSPRWLSISFIWHKHTQHRANAHSDDTPILFTFIASYLNGDATRPRLKCTTKIWALMAI